MSHVHTIIPIDTQFIAASQEQALELIAQQPLFITKTCALGQWSVAAHQLLQNVYERYGAYITMCYFQDLQSLMQKVRIAYHRLLIRKQVS